jgi:macrolide-specific efflux system membrane fusion protein
MVDVLPNAIPEFLRSGMTANVRVIIAEKKDVLLLPADAILTERGATSVLLHDADVRQRQTALKIKTGISDGRNVEIVEGLEEGDVVVRRSVIASGGPDGGGRNPFMPSRMPGRR